MSPLKCVCIAVLLSGAFAASSALAECTKSQEIALATQATRAVTAELGKSTRQNVMRIRDCEAGEDGVIKADFVFDYVDAAGVQSVSGSVESNGQRVTALNLNDRGRRVALDDSSSYSETSYGPYRY
jgi:hypothetical protein